MLFSAGQDQTLRVWKLDGATNQWQCVAVLRQEQGGHRAPIAALWASHPFLFSADYLGTLKVGHWVGVECVFAQVKTAAVLVRVRCRTCPQLMQLCVPASMPPAPQVWDLTTGTVRQTIDKAHSGSDIPAITDLTVGVLWAAGPGALI